MSLLNNRSTLTLALCAALFASTALYGCSKPDAGPAREASERIKIADAQPQAPEAVEGHGEGAKLETVAVKDLPGDAAKAVGDAHGPTAKAEAPKPEVAKPEEPKVEKPKVEWTTKKTEPTKETHKKAEPVKEAAKKPEPAKAPEKTPEKAAEKPAIAKPAAKPVAKPIAKIDASKTYIVNVASFTGRAKADEIMGILAKRGDNVYMTEFIKDGQTWYRVRVGFFPSFSKATAYAKKVSDHPEMKGAWVTKPTPDEAAKYAK